MAGQVYMGSMYWVWASTLKDWDRAGCGVEGDLGGKTIQLLWVYNGNSYCNVCMCPRILYLYIMTDVHTWLCRYSCCMHILNRVLISSQQVADGVHMYR